VTVPAPLNGPRVDRYAAAPVNQRARTALAVVAGIALVAYAWWVAGLEPFTDKIFRAVVWPGAVFAVYAIVSVVRARRGREPQPLRFGWGWMAWVVAIVLLGSWQMYTLFHSPRTTYPTVSYLINQVTSHRPLLALMFLLWIAFGVELMRAGKRA
jgi:hypothetical protein